MKNLIVMFLMCSAVSLSAQEAKTLFVNMPDSLLPLLSAIDRADCIDFRESKMKAQVKNKFGRISEMTELTSDYIRLQLSPQSSWQMKVLSVGDATKVICTVSTACAPACDSCVRFFTDDWKELPTSDYLTPPAEEEFFSAPDTADLEKYTRIRAGADMFLMKVDLSEADNTLSFTYSAPDYMEKEAAKELEFYIRGPLVYEWENSNRFIRK